MANVDLNSRLEICKIDATYYMVIIILIMIIIIMVMIMIMMIQGQGPRPVPNKKAPGVRPGPTMMMMMMMMIMIMIRMMMIYYFLFYGPKAPGAHGAHIYVESVTTYCQASYLLSGKLPTVRQSYLLSG